MMPTQPCEAYQELLSGYLDGELTQGDRQRVELHVASCAACQETFEEMTRLRDGIGKLSFGEMSSEEWSTIMNGVTVRTSRLFGWLMYIGGSMLLLGYGAYEFAIDEEVPAMVKTGLATLVIGLGMLLFSVVRQRIISARHDKYKDVQI